MKIFTKFAFLILFLSILAMDIGLNIAPFTYSDVEPVTLKNWAYRWEEAPKEGTGRPAWFTSTKIPNDENWHPIVLPKNPEDRKNQNELWLRTKIPDMTWRDMSLSIQIYEHYEIYTTKGKFYSYGSMDPTKRLDYPGTPQRIISLPIDSAGDDLYIRVFSASSNIGIIGQAQIGSKADFYLRTFRKDIDKLVLGSFYVLTAVVFLYAYVHFRKQKLFGSFTFFSLFFGIYAICRTSTVYYLYDVPILWTYIELISLYLGVAGITMLIEQIFITRSIRLIRVLWQFHLVYAAISFLLIVTHFVTIPQSLAAYQVVIVLTMMLLLHRIYLETRRGTEGARALLTGSMIVCTTGILDIMQNVWKWMDMVPPLTTFGLFVFICMLLVQIIKRLMELMVYAQSSKRLTVVSQLAAGVAHEIRNPIAVISGFVQLMQKKPDQTQYLDLISTEVKRINDIVSDFLFFAKPIHTQMVEKYVPEIVEQTLALFRDSMQEKGIEIRTISDSRITSNFCEPNQLKQVFINVIKNAMESMPSGGLLTITMKVNKSNLRIRIIDQGVGIAPEEMQRIGEPFFTTKETGTGLGLMVCAKIIEYHGGKLEIRSKLNKGTTVEIILPMENPMN
ncbi:ATP-binding protein [Paenibacillus sp. N1-5-1-14]|uniref:ATP-binding protein n=1 Tax=Paenibacillus radicibacter TaxID=2972488 RepID=UPI00215940FD|nr:ATP-binding protein [Paenibacillus radicibacter]MCR8643564.1 ATP-binding protein [Paenibacillus radicibacter]